RLAPSSVAAHGKAPDKATLRKKALDELIVRELAYQKAKQRKLTVARADMNATVAKIKGHYNNEGSFREALKAEQIGEPEFLERVRKDLLLRQIFKLEINDKAAITPGEVEEYFRGRKEKFFLPESVRLFHIWARGDQQAAKSK